MIDTLLHVYSVAAGSGDAGTILGILGDAPRFSPQPSLALMARDAASLIGPSTSYLRAVACAYTQRLTR